MKSTFPIALTVSIIFGLPSVTAASTGNSEDVGPGYSVEMSRMISMRDSVQLEAWIFKPSGLKSKAPTVLCLTQYELDGMTPGRYFTQRGYVYAQVYVRGRGRSGGVKSENLGLQVGRDGYEVVEWIAAQPWSDGRAVMYGASFVGMTQWRTAAQVPPHLAGIAPYVPIYPGWDVPNTNGIPQSWTAVIMGGTSGRSYNRQFFQSDYWQQKMLEQYAHYRPFRELDDAIGIAQECCRALISHCRRNRLQRFTRSQCRLYDGHSPVSQVRHGCCSHHLSKVSSKASPGHAGDVGKSIQVPRSLWMLVHGHESLRKSLIA